MTTASTGGYTVLARRFRPQAFGDVVGQEHVAQALRNAIRTNRVAHAYLFTGARGVGKTSTARILAKALNCPHAEDGNPCNECEICQGISAGQDVDVLEIDGASNRGIDEIRQLRANVGVRSMRTRFKIYIIDEVHMLTREAFNALLKTLEEPPPNVKFVFCTTEPGRVPDTVRSRCQRFDFGTIETGSIRDRLRQIAQLEGVQVDDAALELVARRAAGSMRDSQSIFDQLLAFGEERITADDVHRLLGTASDDRLIALAGACVARDPRAALVALQETLDAGVQLGELVDQLLACLRDLMVLAAGASGLELLSVAPVSRPLLADQAARWGLPAILAAMQILADTRARMQRTTGGRALVELALVRIAQLDELVGVGTVIERLRATESANTGTPARPGAAGSRAASASTGPEKKNEPAVVPVTAPAASAPIDPPDDRGLADSPPPARSPRGAGNEDGGSPFRHGGIPDAVNEPVERSPDESSSLSPTGGAAGTGDESPEGRAMVLAGRIPFEAAQAPQLWSQVIAEVNDVLRSHVRAVSRVAILAPNRLELTFPRKYHFSKRYCEKPESLTRLQQVVSQLTGQEVRLSLLVGDDDQESESRAEPAGQAGSRAGRRPRIFRPGDDPFVTAVAETFSAQVVRIDPVVDGSTGNRDGGE